LNDAKILPQEVLKPFTLVFNYKPTEIENNLSIENLTLAYSEDEIKWKILKNILHEKLKSELSIVTKQGGYYMLVGR